MVLKSNLQSMVYSERESSSILSLFFYPVPFFFLKATFSSSCYYYSVFIFPVTFFKKLIFGLSFH